MDQAGAGTQPTAPGLAAQLITVWALLGGVMLGAVVAVNLMSVLGGLILNTPFPGDFELTEMGTAIAVFAFLPYCQLTRANVSADIFTARAGPRWVAGFGFVGALVALGFSLLLGWRMYFGLLDQKTYHYMTAILQIPQWWAFVPILFSLALLALAGVMSLGRGARDD